MCLGPLCCPADPPLIADRYTDFTPSEEMQQQIEETAGEDMYTKMAQSIAPEIFGHEVTTRLSPLNSPLATQLVTTRLSPLTDSTSSLDVPTALGLPSLMSPSDESL